MCLSFQFLFIMRVKIKLFNLTHFEYIFTFIFFRYELSDGQYREETINIIGDGTPDEEIVVTGEYSFTVDGNTYLVKYTADKNGYHAETIRNPAPFSQMEVPVRSFALSPNILKSLVG